MLDPIAFAFSLSFLAVIVCNTDSADLLCNLPVTLMTECTACIPRAIMSFAVFVTVFEPCLSSFLPILQHWSGYR
jgi:hypothetical protein